MLIEFKVQNNASFNTSQTLSMLASSSTKENFNEENTIPINKFGITNVVKSAAVFGANASGKTNLFKSFLALQNIVLNSLTTAESDNLDTIIPFLLKDDPFDNPCEFEVLFFYHGNLYRYGISIVENIISEEWLYWTKTSRETMLFYRTGQKVEINKRSFSESIDFVKEKDGTSYVEKTRENVPFLSVLSQFNGQKSRTVVDWFKKLKIVSGISESSFQSYTIELFDNNPKFKSWALEILSALQIQDISILEVDTSFPEIENMDPNRAALQDVDLKAVYSRLSKFIHKNKFKEKKIEIVKSSEDGSKKFNMPLSFESEGTIKLIYLLGPLYDVINNGKILLMDEFENKFHSLLSKYIIELYHKNNNSNSQLIITCHDTNLLTNELFRRDQIWFIEKNSHHESELYSLLEYKEHYTRKDGSYCKDYLNGKYGAIPLLKSIDQLSMI